MFSDMIKPISCEFCESGRMYYNHRDTFEAWQDSDIFRLDDMDKLEDGIISEILIMVCDVCQAKCRYTFKEIEKIYRKRLSDKMLTMIAMGDLPDAGSLRPTDRIMIYCGKCNGHDGKGTCPRIIYDKCELKRLPKNGI